MTDTARDRLKAWADPNNGGQYGNNDQLIRDVLTVIAERDTLARKAEVSDLWRRAAGTWRKRAETAEAKVAAVEAELESAYVLDQDDEPLVEVAAIRAALTDTPGGTDG